MADELRVAPDRRARFGLRSLFCLIALIAILIWAGLRSYEWYVSTPLSAAVASFNSRASTDPALQSIAPLTEDEIVAAVESRLASPDYTSSPDAAAITSFLSQIKASRRLPKGAWLEMQPNYQANSTVRIWRIELYTMTSKNSGYMTVVRNIPKPESLGKDIEPAAFSTPASPLGSP